ncbi:MAG: GDP-mannose 4,6-dehydratase [Deltaproteobacteria bacterium]|nr:GDP-mannose 4,6-dehydratase [Deltaproteobacteria bacterium]
MSDFWKLKNVFITGCSGFLGYWLSEHLLKEGANVVGLVRDFVPQSSFYRFRLNERITVIRGKVEEYPLLERILNEYEIDTVFHLAAQTIVEIANRSPLSTFETNIQGTWNLMEACRSTHPLVKRIVASTFFSTYKLPVCCTRCGNFYGGGDLNFNRIVSGTIRSVLHNKPVEIRSDGTPKRDYIYIKDAVSAYSALAEHMEERNVFGEAFNFSGGKPLSVLDITTAVLALMDKKDHPVEILNHSSGEIKDQYLSIEKAKKILDWSPHYSIEDGLRETIDWYQDFFG